MRDEQAIETESTELLRTLIRNGCVNTGEVSSGHEARSVDALEAFFAGSGLACERYTSEPGRTSLITRLDGSDRRAPTLLLMGHTDVVPVTPSGWQRDPFAAELVDGIVWGRGAIDMLNLTATMAVATRRLATSGWKPRGTLIYLAVADEEAGGFLGAGHLVDKEPTAVKCDYVITESGGVPIPTKSGHKLKVTVGEKGGNWRRLIVHGTPGHGSRPFRTDNALVTAARIVQRIAEYRPKARILDAWRGYVEALELEPGLTDALTDPARVYETVRDWDNLTLAREAHACTHTTFSPNIAHGGTKVNVIPDRVDIDVDIRSLPGVEQHEVEAMLKEAMGDLADRVTIETPPDRKRGGTVSPTDTPLMAAISRIATRMMPDASVVPTITTGGTDAKFFRWKGIPAYGFGLHSLRIPYTEYPIMFHGHNERVDTESLKLSAMMWEALCREFLC
ncbi:MAG: M20/M25/M40 family metallo-hydrolase [Candidatus Rokuibacteriota bacterium]|nr:MAG: M20/M25/M40 family metallo-hydrolase [Candidatus Rokubacteria bacterium]